MNYKSPMVVLSALLLGVALLASTNVVSIPRVSAATRTISLVGSTSAWNSTTSNPNPTITVTQGDTIIITLTSTDTTHQFALDVDQDGPMFLATCPKGDTCSAMFDPTTPTSITIPVSFAPGTYKYFCTIHSTMVGNFNVISSGTVGGTVLPTNKLALIGTFAIYAGLVAAVAAIVATTAFILRTRRRKTENHGSN